MSNLATVTQLTATTPQLPVAWYFDPKIHELEQQYLFSRGPNYVGHELMVPNVGDYFPLEGLDFSKMLVRNDLGVELIGNICRHRQSIIFKEKGNGQNIVCPLHRWTYDLEGKLIPLSQRFTGDAPLYRGDAFHIKFEGIKRIYVS